jgi:hypothetical protein
MFVKTVKLHIKSLCRACMKVPSIKHMLPSLTLFVGLETLRLLRLCEPVCYSSRHQIALFKATKGLPPLTARL